MISSIVTYGLHINLLIIYIEAKKEQRHEETHRYYTDHTHTKLLWYCTGSDEWRWRGVERYGCGREISRQHFQLIIITSFQSIMASTEPKA